MTRATTCCTARSACRCPTTSYLYSSDGLLQSVTDPLTDPLSRVTSFSYDARGRLVVQTAPDPDAGGPQQASTQSYVYDALGNLLASTDALAHTTRVAYDALGRLTSVTQTSQVGGNQVAPKLATGS